MSGFRAGKFDKEEVLKPLQSICPTQSALSLYDIDLQHLRSEGKRLILLDVDNTIIGWRKEDIPQETIDWIESAKAAEFQLCILSNTRNPERLERIAGALGVDFIRGKFKPSRQMYRKALDQFSVQAHEAVMIGDQLFTDILGANRSGIEAIWVKPMTPRDFAGTKISRLGEKIVSGALHRGFEQSESDQLPAGTVGAFELLKIPVVQQFVRFCAVGGLATVIDVGLHYILMFVVHIGKVPLGEHLGQQLIDNFPVVFAYAKIPTQAAIPVLKVITASLAILYSFWMNRRWTFRIRDHAQRFAQLRRFFVVAIIGLGLNALITTSLNAIVPGHAKISWAVATLIATVAVAFWNFSGHKLWTFREHSGE